jgi:V/A-type H+/Na+-transporting ATPase subunit E
MGLEKLRQAILSEAKAEAKRIIDDANKNRVSFLKSQKEAVEQEFERLCKLRMQVIEEEYNRKLIQLKGMAGKQLLDKRNALLKSLFEKAKKRILDWPAQEYAKMMKRLIEKVAGNQEGKIRVHSVDKDVFQKVLSELAGGSGDARITLDQRGTLPERGGFIFVGATFEVDQTLDTILKEIEHDLLPAIAADLFPGK